MLLFIHNLLATDTETLVDDHWRSGSNMWGARDAGLASRCNFFNFHAVLPKILPNTIAFRPKLWGPPPSHPSESWFRHCSKLVSKDCFKN